MASAEAVSEKEEPKTPATKKTSVRKAELQAVGIRKDLSRYDRIFRIDDDIKASCQKIFKYIPYEMKLNMFAEDTVGVISDTYILYAIAMLGTANRETIVNFLSTIKKKDSSLYISMSAIQDRETFILSVKNLSRAGFLFRHCYNVIADDENGNPQESLVTLYSLSEDGLYLVNNKLSKKLAFNAWFQAKPLSELVGWASAAYCGTMLAQNSGFHGFIQGVFHTKLIGTVMMPPTILTDIGGAEEDHPAYVMFMPAFLHQDDSYQTEFDYEQSCKRFVNAIQQYFYDSDVRRRYGRAVIVVEDNDDLVNAASRIAENPELQENYDRIFFTGEGVFRAGRKLSESFLKMVADESDPSGFKIVAYEPDFVHRGSKASK